MGTVLFLLFGSTTPLTTSAQSDDPPAKPSGLSTEAGDTQVRLSWEDPDDSTIDKYQLWQIAQSATLTEGTNDAFGYSVAVVGDIAVVGMPDDDESSGDSGAAFVFSRVDGVWTQKYKLKTDDDVEDDGFGTSVAFDGSTIVVGAPFDDVKKGATYLFVKPDDGWDNPSGTGTVDLTETAKLTAPNAAAGDEFGNSVAVDGDTVVVGAYGRDVSTGVAYVFTKPGTDANSDGSIDWKDWASLSADGKAALTANLTIDGAASGDEFGNSVAIDANTIVVGASGDDGDALKFTGSAFVFVMPGSGGWVSTSTAAKLTASTRGDNDYFGRSVAIDGDTIVVGADEAENTVDGSQVKTGSAYVFTKPGTGWATDTEMAKLTASDSAATDKFGYAVALDGDIVVVGAYGDDVLGSDSGSAYVFSKPASGWADGNEAAKLNPKPSDDSEHDHQNDKFGFSVSIDDETIVIGSETYETAYVFDIDDWADIAGSNAATKSHIVRRLTNGIEHTFRMRAVNRVGGTTRESVPSDSVSETPTAADYAPARALNFSARQTGVGQVELTWAAHRYPLTVVAYEFTQDEGANWTAIAGSDSGTNSHTITGLGAGDYTFAVRAVNDAGMGASSDSQSIAVVDKSAAPDSFSAVAGDGQVWLGWRSPADFTISKYEYQQKEGNGAFGGWQEITGSRSGTTFHIVTGLTNGTSYTFRVRAFNAAGGSDSSGEQSATPATASSAPVKPEGFAASQTSVGQVELTWDPSSNPLTVTGYEFTQNNGSTWTTISGSDHSTVSHTLNNLNTGYYTFAIRAVNGPYVGDSSGAQSLTVVAKPAALTELTINDPEPGSGIESDIGDTQVRLKWNDPDNASITKYQLWQFPPTSIKLISSDRAKLDELGWSVAVDGDTLVIGALGADEPNNTGAAYVFTRDARGWTQSGKLTASVRRDDAGFGHAVAVHGDTIVVGAYEEDHPYPPNVDIGDVGAAYVFTKPANGWADMTQTARLIGSNTGDGDEFGSSVAVYGETIVVGAPERGPGGDGSAYIFTKPGDAWTDSEETAELKGASVGGRFGRSVAVYGDTVVVGEPEADGGAAYVFTKRAAIGVWDDWHETSAGDATAKLTASASGSGDYFGRAVAFDGETIVVGAPYDDDPDNSGSAYVFTKPASGGWVSTSTAAKLTASDRAEKDEFGYSVAVDGDTVVVGARQPSYQDGGVTIKRPGSAYLFTKPPTGWTDAAGTDKRTIYDRRGDDSFGNSVAIDGDTVLVGASYDDNSGSAYVFGTEAVWADIPGSGAATVAHIATRLPNGAEHNFRVRAVNAAGADAASNSVLATPKAAEAAPAAPATPSAEQTGVGQVELEWDEVTDATRLTITGFDYTQDGTNWPSIDGSDSATNSHTVSGLSTGTTYTFAIRAKNSAGVGTSSANSDNVTLVALPAAPTGFSAAAGDKQVSLSWTPGDSSITKYQLLQFEPNKLIDDNVLQDDNFGYSVAVDGDTAVIGVYHDNLPRASGISFKNAGSAYVFVRQPNSGGWRQVAHLTASDPADDDEFGYSVDVDGDTIVVGARQADHDPGVVGDTGAVYVFTKPDTGWADGNETAKLTAYSPVARDEFGISVAVDGETILVGAHQDDHNGTDAGAAYLFTRPYTGWADSPETTKLIPADGAPGDQFGISVAVDGNMAVIGANKDDDNGDDSGSAYVFTKVSGGWSQRAKLTASDGEAGDEFGISVAVDDDTAVIGANKDDDNGDDSGSAYVFTRPDTGWAGGTEAAKLTASDGAADDEFGISVAVDGDTIVVGANKDDHNGDDSGSAYVFVKPDAGWADGTETAKFTAPDGAAGDRYGHSVGASGDNVLVGAPSLDSTENSGGSGAAYLLRVSDWTDVPGSGEATVDYDVFGLTNGVEYTFQIRGVNNAGPGAASDDSSGTPRLLPPAQPAGLLAEPGDEQVRLSWSYSGGRTSITGFQYQQKTGDDFGDDWTDITGSTWGTRSHVVTRLTNQTPYDFRVRAVNAGGESAASNTVTSTPKAVDSRPASPANFNAEQTGVGQVELTWKTAEARLTVTGYQYTADGGSNWTAIPGSDSATVSYTVSGLTVSTTYTFAVRAVNSGTLPGLSSVPRYVTIVGEPRAPTAVTATGGDTQATFRWNVTPVTTDRPIDKQQLLHLPQSRLTADDGSDNDEFGASVAIDGDTAVVGAPGRDTRDTDGTAIADAGVVHVFVRDAQGVWRPAGTLTASDRAANDEFGTAVAVEGDTVVVGAPQQDVDGDDDKEGASYVFTKPVSGWEDATETAKLIASDGAADDEFGISVAVSGNIVVVGARGDDSGKGIVYVFVKPTTSNGWADWVDTSGDETAKLTAIGGATGEELGISVAIDGDTVVAGAHLHDIDDSGSSILNAGAAYVFTKPTDGWVDNTQGAKFTAPDGGTGDEFGISVAINVDTVVVGAHKHDANSNSDAGAAYVFNRDSNSGEWGQPVKLTASNGGLGDGFGNSVAVDGNTAVVGAYLDDRDNAALDTGSTYVFARKLGVWSQTLNLAGPDPDQDDGLGYSVAVDDGTLLAGAPQDDNNPGFAYAMDISDAEWADFVPTGIDDDGKNFYRVLNLTNDQEYAFRVRSVNAAANRPSAETVAATPMLAKPGRTEGLSAKAGNRRVTLSWDDPRDSSLIGYQVLQPPEQIKLTAGSDGETGGEFGESVAVDDGTAVVGASGHDGTDSGGNAITDAGAAYVFTRNPNSGAWSDPIELTAGSDGAENDWFGYSVAVDGNTIVVGAYQNDADTNNNNEGSAYIFTKVDGEWSGPVKLIASDTAANDWFGYSVAVDDDTIVVGARWHNGKAGAAYVFTRDSGTGVWGDDPGVSGTQRIQTAKLTASDGGAFNYFGHSVAVHGETIVIGAPGYNDSTGVAYVFTRDSGTGVWGNDPEPGETHRVETAKLTAFNGHAGDGFGNSVAVDGNTAVVGAQQGNGERGSAYVFTEPTGDGGWADNTETAKLAASDRELGDHFGNSVAVRGGSIVVGAYTANINECDECDDDPRSGAAYLFTKPANVDWSNDPNEDHRTESGKLILPTDGVEEEDGFGNSVALDGQSIVVGAPQDDDEFGSVYVSDIPRWAFLASGAETTSATVGGLTNGVEYTFQVRAVDYVGMGPGSDSARARPRSSGGRDPNRPPSFRGVSSFAFTVDENTPPGTLVGSAVTATDADGDVLTYSLSGTDASSFGIDSSTGQLFLKNPLDYEAKSVYEVTVRVSDDNNASVDVDVTIVVNNVDEAGMVAVSSEQPQVGTAVAVSLLDPDGSVFNISWQWARSYGSNWIDISGADSNVYTPVTDDAGSYLRATASYVDRFGSGKSAHVVSRLPTVQRGPSFEGDVTLSVDENTQPGSLVGDAITATDPEGDILTYSLWGADASFVVRDRSTGQITVGSGTTLDYESGPTRYTVVVSVHDGRDVYGNDDATVDDSIEVNIDVSNVDEAGTVAVSLEQPQVGTALVVSLSDPDGSVSDISWQWARSLDGSDWSDVSGANSDSYIPVAADVGSYLRATASYTDGHGPGKTAHAVSGRPTAQRTPTFQGDVTLTVDENTLPGAPVGSGLTATDPDGDILTYSLSGTDASSFVIDGSTGQIIVGSGTMLDYESGARRYTVVVSVHDGSDAYGNDDTAIDAHIEVNVDVNNVDEAGTVSVSSERPKVGAALAASLTDLDGSVSDISWQWAASTDRANWQDTAGASSSTYTPVDRDGDKYLRVTASYGDGEGSGKQAQAVLRNPVEGLPEPVATPTPTATNTPAPMATDIPASEPTPTPTLTAPSPTPTTEPAPSEADGGDERFPWWAIVAVVIGVVAGVVLIIVVLRSRR